METKPDRGRIDMRADEVTRLRLKALSAKMELSQAAVVRMAVRLLAEREGVEVRPNAPEP